MRTFILALITAGFAPLGLAIHNPPHTTPHVSTPHVTTPHVSTPHTATPHVTPHEATAHPHERSTHVETSHTAHITGEHESASHVSAAHVSHPSAEHEHKVTHTNSKSLSEIEKTKSPQKVEATASPMVAKPLQPSPEAAKASINHLFTTATHPHSLTSYQIKNLAKDSNIKGQEAAMLAALIMQVNDVKNPKDLRFNKEDLLKKFSDPKSNLYIAYSNTLTKINQVKSLPAQQKLFGPEGLSAKTNIIQGSENDCYFLSAINSLLKTPDGAQSLQKMITPDKNNPDQFSVKFPGDPTPITVTLTEAEIGMYSHVEKGGKWLAILSVAEATQRDKKNLNPEVTMQPGYQTQTMRLLTGNNYVQKNLSTNPTAQESKQLVDIINKAVSNGSPIGIQTSDHDLSIIGYNNGNVTIKNPWGTNEWYNPKTGGWSTTGKPTTAGPWYSMKDGVFTVPIAQIANGFEAIAYHPENNKTPTTPPASPIQPPTTTPN